MNDYYRMLEEGFAETRGFEDRDLTRLQFLSEHIFDFITYDDEMSELFATRALQVCEAINNKKTFEYIAESDQHCWYLLMVNMPFFNDKLEWGTSIRGAWWAAPPRGKLNYSSTGLWLNGHQMHETMEFTEEEWREFVSAVLEFGRTPPKGEW